MTPPQTDNNCQTTPTDYAEKLVPSGGRKMAFQVPCMPGHGKVRVGAFIKDKEIRFLPYVLVLGNGDNRDFDPSMGPDSNKVYVEVDFSTGTGYVFVAHSCSDATLTNCEDALEIGDNFSAAIRRDGSVSLTFQIGNSRPAGIPIVNWFKISADLVILPLAEGTASAPENICIVGDVSSFPSAEAYYDNFGATYTLYQLTQKPYGALGLGIPDRKVPGC